MLYPGVPCARQSINHSRCCARDNGARSPVEILLISGILKRNPSFLSAHTRDATALTVGSPKKSINEISTLKIFLIALTACVANREWPPSSKKLSHTPTRSKPNNRAHSPARTSSSGVLGGRYRSDVSSRRSPGGGKRLRSTFPFAFRGNESSTTNAEGIMNSGSLAESAFLNSPTRSPESGSPSGLLQYRRADLPSRSPA